MKVMVALVAALVVPVVIQAQEVKEKEVKIWKHEAFFELTGRTGIIEKKRHAGGVTSIRQTKGNRLKLYAAYVWAEDSGVKNEEEYIAGIDNEITMSEHTAWYGRLEYESDDIEELRHRITVATGLSYYFLKEDKHKLRGRIGAFWRDEDYKIFDNTRTVGLELGIFHEYHIKDVGVWTTEVVYTPSLEEEREYRITYESKLGLPLASVDGLSMELGVYGQYNNYTPGPTEHYDTNYFVRLKYKW